MPGLFSILIFIFLTYMRFPALIFKIKESKKPKCSVQYHFSCSCAGKYREEIY